MSLFSGNRLIGSPKRNNQERARGNLEFTPIGGRKTSKTSNDTKAYRSPLRPLSTEMNKPYGRAKGTTVDSSFDNTADVTSTLASFEDRPMTERMPTWTGIRFLAQGKESLLNNGLNPIKEQQLENQKLEAENYNLKIKLATLTRYFDLTPEEQKELLTQNIDLKQQLMNAASEIQRLSEEREQNSSSKNDNDNSVLSDFHELIAEKESKLQEYKERIRSLQEDLMNRNDDHSMKILEQELQNSKSENMSLKSNINSLQKQVQALEAENQEVKNRIATLNEQDHASYSRLTALNKEAADWRDKYDHLETEFRKLQLIDKKNRTDFDSEREYLKSEIMSLERESSDLRKKLASRDDDVKTLLKDVGNGKGNTEVLESEIERLHEEIKEKDREMRNLKMRMNSLLENGRMKNNDALNAVSSELESARSRETRLQNKINELEAEMETELRMKNLDLEAFKRQEKKLQQSVSALKDEISHLRNQLYENGTNSSEFDKQIEKLRKRNSELEDKLTFYESEYDVLEKAMASVETELEITKQKYNRAEDKLATVQLERQDLADELRQHLSAKVQKSALQELENFNLRKIESERDSLNQMVRALEQDIRRLSSELALEKTKNNSRFETDLLDSKFRNLLDERNKIHGQLTEKLIQIKELQKKIDDLHFSISERDSQVEKLETRILEMERLSKAKSFEESEEKSELLRSKKALDSKVRILELEKTNLESTLKTELDFYRNKVETLLKRQEQNDYVSSRADSQTSSIVSLLEKQLEETNKSKSELTGKVSELIAENDQIKQKIEKLQKDKEQLIDLTSEFEKNEKYVKLQKSQLESDIDILNKELSRANSNCSKLARKLQHARIKELSVNINSAMLNKYQGLMSDNMDLQKKIEDLNTRFASTSLIETPKDLTRLRLLENELLYYRARLHDMNLKSNDLEIMYQFVIKSITNSNELIKNDIVKLSQCGIYPDYSAMQLQKLKSGDSISFKVLAQFVLATIRLRKRAQKAQYRKQKLSELKKDIEIDKISLLA